MVNQPLVKRNLKIPYANMRRLYRVKSLNKAKDGGTVSFGLKSKEKILTGQTIGAFKGKKVSHKEMLRRQELGLGGYTLGLLGKHNYLDCYAEAKSTPIKCLLSMANTANNLYAPNLERHLTSKDNNSRVVITTKTAILYATEDIEAGTEILWPYGTSYIMDF